MTRLIQIAGSSDTGRVREHNEDSFVVADLDRECTLEGAELLEANGARGPLMVVCDGVGGSVGGEVASAMACHVIHQHMQSAVQSEKRGVLARNLRKAVRGANQEIVAAAIADRELRGMGTTVSAAAIVGNTAVIAQIGDSRAYVLRRERLIQITRDQSVVAAMVQAGAMSPEQAPYSMQRGRILQAVGTGPDVEVSLSIAELRAGDRLLLCSDGLHSMIPDAEIAEVCVGEGLQEAVTELIARANKAGGPDNITVLLAQVSGEGFRPPMPDDDELHFVEIDHALEGEDALSTTSIIGHRLAHRAGIRKDGFPLTVPATAQYAAMTEAAVEADAEGAAQRALAQGKRLGALPWVVVACLAALGLFSLLYWL